MTRMEGRDASERRRGIGEDKRQPVIAQLAIRLRHSNLVALATLRKRNCSGEA